MAQLKKYDRPLEERERQAPEYGPEEWYWEVETHDVPPPDWLIEGTLPERSVNMLFGPFNLGKTFLALDWAACVSAGRKWLGRETKKRDVLYVASEGDPGGLGMRMKAWRQRWNQNDAELRILFYADMLNITEGLEALLDAALDRGLRPGLVIVDTLAMAMVDDENSNTAMNDVVKACRRNQTYERDGQEYEVSFLLVHHTGWEDDKPRGGSAMPGGLDYVIGMKSEGNVRGFLKLWMYKAKRSNKDDWGPYILRVRPFADDAVIEMVEGDEYATESSLAKVSAGATYVREFLLDTGAEVGTTLRQIDVAKWVADRDDKQVSVYKGTISEAFKELRNIGYLNTVPNSNKIQVGLDPEKWYKPQDVEDL